MNKSTEVSKLEIGGVFAATGEFDLGVRRVNQDRGKLFILARRNTKTITTYAYYSPEKLLGVLPYYGYTNHSTTSSTFISIH